MTMTPGTLSLVAAAVAFLPALVWTIEARSAWHFLRTRRPRHPVFRLVPIMAGTAALFYVAEGALCLAPGVWLPAQSGRPAGWFMPVLVVNDWSMFLTLALARHVTALLARKGRPGRRWLAVNYGSALVMASLTLFPSSVMPGETFRQQVLGYLAVVNLYAVVMLALVVMSLVRLVRRGAWWPASASFAARRADVLVLAGGALGMALVLAAILVQDAPKDSPTGRILLSVLISWSFAVPLAVRILRQVVRGVLVVVVTVAALAAVYVGAHALTASYATDDTRRFFDLGALGALLVIAIPFQSWLWRAVDRFVFGHPRGQRAELQAFLHSLPPGLGALECCRRALVELVRVRQLRGAGLLLRDGETAVHGRLEVDALARCWPRGAALDALPDGALVSTQFLELSADLGEALLDADVIAISAVASPRGRRGYLFMTAGPLGSGFDDEELEAIESFCDQLALLLDGAELLARAVRVERSLAHAQKLAAIGELAARLAHDIRNPVTAARSLAQQLVREATPFAEEHALILGELDRVERQVVDLLHFARRDELHLRPVDLGTLVRATLADLRPRLEAAQVDVEIDAPGEVIAHGDPERLRQLLVDLVENAVDALAGCAGVRRLSLGVGGVDGVARLRIADNGPGVPAEALPHLFEPFFSLKAHGTGLGLAIAKRTVEAHGGRIDAAPAPGAGLTFHVELPLAGPAVA
jgi:signal transduction histidine kinase